MSEKNEDKGAGGRPSMFRENYINQAYKLCLLGATDAQLGDFFGVSEQTINSWKKEFPEFLESIKSGKEEADAKVAKSLYDRANGYEHKETKVFLHEGKPVTVEVTKHYAPDTMACMYWLNNRQKTNWRNKNEMALTDPEGKPLQPIQVYIPDNGRNKPDEKSS